MSRFQLERIGRESQVTSPSLILSSPYQELETTVSHINSSSVQYAYPLLDSIFRSLHQRYTVVLGKSSSVNPAEPL